MANLDSVHSHPDPMIRRLKKIISYAVRGLAVLMTVVILIGVLDVFLMIYEKMTSSPYFLLTIEDIMATFGAFMAVMIAIEIFINIAVYLRDDVMHVKIVMATALMAVARKVIILDWKELPPPYLWGLAALILATSLGYWFIAHGPERGNSARNSALN